MMSVIYPAWVRKNWTTGGEETVSGVIGEITVTSDNQVTMVLRFFPLRRLTQYEFCLALPVLYTSTCTGAVVDYISLSRRAQRSQNKPAPVAYKKASDQADGGNGVDASLKCYALGGSDLFAITNICFTD